jgi:hypothetical protein
MPYHWYGIAAAKYEQDNFIPFILETGGRVNTATRDWLDTLTAPEPGEQVPSQAGRPPMEPADANDHRDRPKGGDVGARVQALVRVQAHMLARIAVEICAADIAAELEP